MIFFFFLEVRMIRHCTHIFLTIVFSIEVRVQNHGELIETPPTVQEFQKTVKIRLNGSNTYKHWCCDVNPDYPDFRI